MSVINKLINNAYTITTLIVCHVYMYIFHVCIKNIIFSIYKSITFLLFPSGLTNTNPNHNEWCENEKLMIGFGMRSITFFMITSETSNTDFLRFCPKNWFRLLLTFHTGKVFSHWIHVSPFGTLWLHFDELESQIWSMYAPNEKGNERFLCFNLKVLVQEALKRRSTSHMSIESRVPFVYAWEKSFLTLSFSMSACNGRSLSCRYYLL